MIAKFQFPEIPGTYSTPTVNHTLPFAKKDKTNPSLYNEITAFYRGYDFIHSDSSLLRKLPQLQSLINILLVLGIIRQSLVTVI